MNEIRLRRPPTRINFGKVFWRAVKGYKKLKVKSEVAPSYPIPIEMMQAILGKGEIKAEKAITEEKPKGVPITAPTVSIGFKEPEIDLKSVNIIYTLIPSESTVPFAAANIRWSNADSSLFYYLIEPELNPAEKELLEKIKTTLVEKLDIDFTTLRKGEARGYLKKKFEESINLMASQLPYEKRQQILYFIDRDFIGLGKIEPLMQDPNLEDISCDGIGIPIFIYHRNPLIGSIKTNIVFGSAEEVDTFVNKLAQRCGKSISIAQPLIGGSLPDGSRIQVTLGTDIARKGSNFCIKEGFVQLTDGSIKDIQELFEYSKSIYGYTTDEYENEIVKPDFKVIGVNENNLKNEDATVLQIIKLKPPKRLVKVEFKESGKSTSSIEVTENHKFHVLSDSKIVTIPAGDLRTGMWIPVPTKIDIKHTIMFNKKYLDLVKKTFLNNKESKVYVKIDNDVKQFLTNLDKTNPHLKEIARGKTTSIIFEEFLKILSKKGKDIDTLTHTTCILRKGRKGRGSAITIPLKFTEEFSYLLGWIIGDGNITKNNISIDTGLNDEYRNKILDLIYKLFSVKGKCYKNNIHRIYVNSKLLSSILHTCFSIPIGKKARIVDVPNMIEISSDNIVSAFLRGLFESDGSFERGINLTTFSEKLTNKTIFLLARLGIFAIFYKNGDSYRVFIPAEYYEKFSKKILNNEKIKYFVNRHDSTKKSKMLPASYVKLLIDILRKNKVRLSDVNKFINVTDTMQRSRISFRKIKILNDYVKKFEKNEITELIDNLTSEKFEFLEIANIEINENKENFPVYDVVCNPVNFYIGGKNRPMFLHDTIRRFTKNPLTPVHLIKFKTIDPRIAAFLWLVIEYGRSVLITGGVATGKTTLLNALSLFIKPELRIVSIEDTAELMLPHLHWVPSVARLPIAEIEGKKLGEVDLFDLLKESLRQRPDYLIVGEVRGKEAYVLFQQIATGHASMSTIHADSMERLVDRLTTPPISLPASLIEALDIIIFAVRIKYGSTYVRRINSIYEVLGFDREKNFPLVNEIFKWNPTGDTYETVNPSFVLKKISQQYGIREEVLQREISQRIKVINWMFERDIEDYINVAKIIKLYYTRPEDLLGSL